MFCRPVVVSLCPLNTPGGKQGLSKATTRGFSRLRLGGKRRAQRQWVLSCAERCQVLLGYPSMQVRHDLIFVERMSDEHTHTIIHVGRAVVQLELFQSCLQLLVRFLLRCEFRLCITLLRCFIEPCHCLIIVSRYTPVIGVP